MKNGKFDSERLFYLLLTLCVAVNFIIAVVLPIHADEAYYALYGKFLDWGYYDHPPMVALVNRFGQLFFSGNLSVRFGTVLLHAATLLLIWKTLPDKRKSIRNVLIFFAIALSLIMFSVYGIITTPDVPLLFFAALFFLLYKKYLSNGSFLTAGALGLTMAAMLYSKYMAVLVFGFVLLSNLKLLKDPKFYFAVLLAALIFVPHIVWQFKNDFPSFQYHLSGRNSHFSVKYPLEYLPNQLLVFNPVCFCYALWICFKRRKTDDLFVRSCIFTIVGFFAFFWIMTVKGHAEPHWTVVASVPMLILLYDEISLKPENPVMKFGIAPIAAVVLLFCIAIVPVLSLAKADFIGHQSEMEKIHDECGNVPVVFSGSFQNPSLYAFYFGEKTTALSTVYLRRSQFDIWQFDKDLQGKEVFAVIGKRASNYLRIKKKQSESEYSIQRIKNFQSANRIVIEIDNYKISGDTLFLNLTLKNPYNVDFCFNHREQEISLHAVYRHEDKFTATCTIDNNMIIPAGGELKCSTFVQYLPDVPFALCLDNQVSRSLNSKIYHFKND